MNLFIESLIWIAYVLSLYFSIFFLLIYIDKKSFFKNEESSTEIPQEPLVSIFVPAYNEEKTIQRTLESIQNLEYPKDKLEVIVINDGSSDKTEEIIQEYINNKPHFQLLSHKNKGKAASLNRALEVSKGDFFACLDADSFVDPWTLRKMLAFYYKKNNSNLAIITPAMKVASPKNMLQKIQWLEYIVIILIARLTSHLDSLYVAPGPFSLYRKDIIQELGGFDEKNITEDQEIAYRVQKHHYEIKQCFDGYVYTTAPEKIKPFYHQRRRWYLGSIICLHKYKEMMANRKYGDFGIMQMVKNMLGYFLAITGILTAGYLILMPGLQWVKNLFLIKFNIIPYLLALKLRINTMDLLLTDFKKVFVIIFLFAVSLIFFYLAHRNANEKLRKFGWIPVTPYFAFYYVLKAGILIISLVRFSRDRKIKW